MNNNIGADRSSQTLNDFDCYDLHLYRVPERILKSDWLIKEIGC